MTARRCLPTDAWVRWLIVPALVFIAMMTDRGFLADFWHHLARGRAMAEEGQLVDRDLFTFTVPGVEFQDVNWLTQVIYYRLYEWGGLDLVRFVNALTLALTLALLVAVCHRLCGSLAIACAVGIGTFFGLWQVLTIRPQTFSLLLFVLTFDLLERAERRPWLLVFPPFLVGLWANLHGAFPAGIMLIGCFGLASAYEGIRRHRRLFTHAPNWQLAGCLVASLLATLANPYGWEIYHYVGLTSNTAAARRIDEWVPPNLTTWIGRAWLVSLIVMAALLTAMWLVRRKRPTAREVILIGCFLPLACGSVRMVAWWLLIIAPMVAVRLVELWPKTREQEEPQPTLGAGIVCGLIALAVVMSLPPLQAANPLLAGRQGTRIEDDLDAVHARLHTHVPQGKIFSRFEWGEYLSWSYSPAYKVFMDGRIEIYPDKVWSQYADLTLGKADWQHVLDEYGVDVLVLDAGYHAKTGLLPRVQASTQWQCVFEANQAMLFVRRITVAQSR